jgi:hypothetical protein
MRTLLFVLLFGLMCACARVEASRQPVHVDMRNVDLHVSPEVTLHVRHLRGEFTPINRQAPYLDDVQSYSVAVDSGEIAVDLASLNALLDRSLAGERSNIDHLRVSVADTGMLQQKGVIDRKINIPFSARSAVSVTPDGRIRVTTKSVKAFGVPVRPLMKIFSIEMDDLVKVKPGQGVTVADNDMVIDPSRLLPSPAFRGRLTAVRIEDNSLVQVFGSAPARPLASRRLADHHIYWRGGQLSFGKLTMSDTDLELVDMDPRDAFSFSVNDWNAQLVAGYSKTLANRGLRAHMPDYDDLKSNQRVTHRTANQSGGQNR